jgi:hypothetical protein
LNQTLSTINSYGFDSYTIFVSNSYSSTSTGSIIKFYITRVITGILEHNHRREARTASINFEKPVLAFRVKTLSLNINGCSDDSTSGIHENPDRPGRETVTAIGVRISDCYNANSGIVLEEIITSAYHTGFILYIIRIPSRA